ncbi:MAG TPA: hypothetical protein VIX37_02935 [Candidatus Sulfotelmatobacter sp.]
MVAYDQIVSAEIEQGTSDDPAAIVVHTREGRRDEWYRTWLQGIFDPEKTLAKIRAAAHLDDPKPPVTGEHKATGSPSMASRSPSAAG